MHNNPYVQPSKRQIADAEQVKKDIVLKKETLLRTAKECLDDPKFKKYKAELEAFKATVFKQLSEPMYADPIQDAYYLRACMNTILVLDTLVSKPEKDAKEK